MDLDSAESRYFEQRKTPAVASLLSFIVSGAGQIYNGELGKGIGMIAAYILCWATSALGFPVLFLIALWIWGMIDAHAKAEEINSHLKTTLTAEDAIQNQVKEELEKIKAATISTDEFVGQLEKLFVLFQSGMLTEAEFTAKKLPLIDQLTYKKPREAAEDFLAALIPQVKNKALSQDEVSAIKVAIF